MRTLALTLVTALSLAVPALARHEIRFDKDYDPRISLRIVVLPAEKTRSLARVNERTISALLATEMLRIYEVVDLMRFEQYLNDHRLDLTNAFTAGAESVVRDSAHVDAIATIEIFQWDTGTPGIPILSERSGHIGARIRLMDPYTGRIYWSVNRIEGVSPGSDFLDRASDLFRDVVTDINRKMDRVSRKLDDQEAAAKLVAMGKPPRLEGYGSRKFTTGMARERGFLARTTPESGVSVASPQATPRTEAKKTSRSTGDRDLLPPLFQGTYESIEKTRPALTPVQQSPQKREDTGPSGNYPSEAGPPPLPNLFQATSSTDSTGSTSR